jgi:hypothetical protein
MKKRNKGKRENGASDSIENEKDMEDLTDQSDPNFLYKI